MGDAKELEGIPQVRLDTSLYELLCADQTDSRSTESLCLIKPNSDTRHGEAVPLSNKYIIHSSQIEDEDELAHLQLENCSHLLMFFAGQMDVIFLACEGKSKDPTLTRDAVDKNAKQSFDVIQESQRPKIRTFANIEDFVANHDGSKIRWGFAMDFAEQLPYVIHPKVVYDLNSKRWLALSQQLKSANDRVLECKINCSKHKTDIKSGEGLWYYGGATCEECTAGVEAEIQRIRNIIKRRDVPFVLKLTQSLSAVGTNIVQDIRDRDEVLERISEYLSTYLPRVTKENAHLYTTALILSDHIPGATMALNFFVRRDGSVIFLGACHQLATGTSGRQATAITYADQIKLEPKYRKTLDQIGIALSEAGYHGAAGADVMEDEEGNLNTIDLNVRTPLSLLLYLLRGHFYEERGLGVALVYECVTLNISREELQTTFQKAFEEARVVLLGSTRLGQKKRWVYGMVLAGENKDAVDKLSDRIMEYEV